MRIKRTTSRSGMSRRTRLIAIGSTLVAAAAFAVPSANASDTAATFSNAQLTRAGGSVLQADVPGTAWAVDKANHRVVVTVDSTVSESEITKIKQAAGSESGALTIKRTPARSRS